MDGKANPVTAKATNKRYELGMSLRIGEKKIEGEYLTKDPL